MSKEGSSENARQFVLSRHRVLLDFSNNQVNGTHLPGKYGGEAVTYQGRKKTKASNLLILSDNQDNPLAYSNPMDGNHDDAFSLVPQTKKEDD